MKLQITDFTKDGECSNCGNCCSDILPLSSEEVRRIKKYIKKNGIKEQRHNALIGYDMTCPFRNEAERKCSIYEVRPAICRQFMCNHTEQDIMKAKVNFHKINEVVFMRSEFFNNNEDKNCFFELMKGAK